MNTNKKHSLFVLFGILIALLTVLFLLSSTNLILKEDDETTYNISILLPDSSDLAWQNFKKGAEYSATQHNVDLQLITLYNTRNIFQQQSQRLETEILAGADGVALYPENAEMFQDFLTSFKTITPISALGVSIDNEKIKKRILFDYEQMGEALGEAILSDKSSGNVDVMYVYGMDEQTDDTLFYKGLTKKLGDKVKKYEVQIINKKNVSALYDTIKKSQNTAIVTLEPAVLSELARVKDEKNRNRIFLYGVGATDEILNFLEKRNVNAIALPNMYDAGYMCVENLVAQIEKNEEMVTEIVPFKIIKNYEVFLPENEKFIFPIG